MVRGATDKEANDIQATLPVARDLEKHVRSVETKGEAKKRLLKNRRLTMQENCKVFISLIQKLFNMRGESWKFRCQQHCLARREDENAQGDL